jgi:hypothetical protein
MIVVVTNIDGQWHSRFDLKCPRDVKQYTLAGREGPYASAEEAFEKAKQWARGEIDELMETSQSRHYPASRFFSTLYWPFLTRLVSLTSNSCKSAHD